MTCDEEDLFGRPVPPGSVYQRHITGCSIGNNRIVCYRAFAIGGQPITGSLDDVENAFTDAEEDLPDEFDDVIDGYWARIGAREDWRKRDQMLIDAGIISEKDVEYRLGQKKEKKKDVAS